MGCLGKRFGSARGVSKTLARWADTDQIMNHSGDGETDLLERVRTPALATRGS